MASKNSPIRGAKKRRQETEITQEIFPPDKPLFIKELPWTEKQRNVINAILDKDTNIVFINSPAGCGKTSMAVFTSLALLKEKAVDRILFVRNPVEASDCKIGFLPSVLSDKMQPYAQPAFDVLNSMLSRQETEQLKNDGRFSVIPTGFVRGLSFHNTATIVEEASDMTLRDLELVMSRLGKRGKMIIIGSPRQASVKQSGFLTVFNAFNCPEARNKGIFTFEFDIQDSKRSPITKFILEKFEHIDPR